MDAQSGNTGIAGSSPPILGVLPAGARLMEYEIRCVLGKPGGFGVTYLALDTNLQKDVAIKEYLPVDFAVRAADDTVSTRSADDKPAFEWGLRCFLNEARLLARFKHPNVVQVHRLFEAQGTAYIVLEHVQGQTLAEYARSRPPMDQQQIEAFLLPLLGGLETVHEAGVLHRDLKPENILLREDGSPVLIDFGAARNALGGRSRSIMSVLTAGYAPIEQYSENGTQGPWTDLYALGALLYRLITGQKPVDAVGRLGADPVPPLAGSARPGFTPDFLAAVDWALRLRPEDRPQTVAAWRRALAGEDTAPAPSPVQQTPALLDFDLSAEPISTTQSNRPAQAPRPATPSAGSASEADVATRAVFLDTLVRPVHARALGDGETPASAAAEPAPAAVAKAVTEPPAPAAQPSRAEAVAAQMATVADLPPTDLLATQVSPPVPEPVPGAAPANTERRADETTTPTSERHFWHRPLPELIALGLLGLCGLVIAGVLLWSLGSGDEGAGTAPLQSAEAPRLDETLAPAPSSPLPADLETPASLALPQASPKEAAVEPQSEPITPATPSGAPTAVAQQPEVALPPALAQPAPADIVPAVPLPAPAAAAATPPAAPKPKPKPKPKSPSVAVVAPAALAPAEVSAGSLVDGLRGRWTAQSISQGVAVKEGCTAQVTRDWVLDISGLDGPQLFGVYEIRFVAERQEGCRSLHYKTKVSGALTAMPRNANEIEFSFVSTRCSGDCKEARAIGMVEGGSFVARRSGDARLTERFEFATPEGLYQFGR